MNDTRVCPYCEKIVPASQIMLGNDMRHTQCRTTLVPLRYYIKNKMLLLVPSVILWCLSSSTMSWLVVNYSSAWWCIPGSLLLALSFIVFTYIICLQLITLIRLK